MKKRSLSITIIISMIIIAGFGLTSLYSYVSFQSLFMKDIEVVSELSSENIYSNINSLMDRPINVSMTMAHDILLRDFISAESFSDTGSVDVKTLQKYLTSYQQKYQFDSVFFISAKSGNYYHFKNGIDRVMTPDNPENVWYYEFLKDSTELALNVDNDEASENTITIFVNCKLLGDNGEILGVLGVGMSTPYIQDFMRLSEEKYSVKAYLIDVHGGIQVAPSLTQFENVNLFQNKTFFDMQEAILVKTSSSTRKWYHTSGIDGYIISKYIPNLNWYLVVEKNTAEFKKQVVSQLLVGLLFTLFVVSIVVLIITLLLRNNKLALEHLAETDLLTGIRNRTGYEKEIQRWLRQAEQKIGHFGIGVFDLNHLKNINDSLGHQMGDTYIKAFSVLLCQAFPHCPVFRIGGDEFAVFFLDTSEEQVLAGYDMLKQKVEIFNQSQVPAPNFRMEAAFGYAFLGDTLPHLDAVFKAADDAMYVDKARLKG